ncbi:DUF6493 family protein [Actinocorallia herbida]|nr:DUF6493 family protein [Actinocorallia herbida]
MASSGDEVAWERVRAAIAQGDARKVAAVVGGFGEETRKEVGKRLPEALRGIDDRTRWTDQRLGPLRVAGAGCLGGAAAAAAWVARRDLRGWRDRDGLGAAIAAAVAGRPSEWRLDFARRLTDRIRLTDLLDWRADRVLWDASAALLRAEGGAPPASAAFAAGWLLWRPAEPLAEDPFFPVLLPALFDADGIGPLLGGRAPFGTAGPPEPGAVPALGAQILAHADRAFLLDGCVRRFLRGGDGARIAWYVALHRALAPAPEESAPRLRDYVRLLPNAAPPIAETAFEQVKAVDALAPLAPEMFTETANALLFRPERKLLKAALIWLDKTAKGRETAAVAQAAVAFAIEHTDTRERAVRLAVRHAAAVDPLTAETVRDAAGALPGPLRARIADAYGGAVEPEAPIEAPVLYAPAPSELDPPIASAAELREAVLAHLHASRSTRWPEVERLLAGLVVYGPDIIADLRGYGARFPWIVHPDFSHLDGAFLVMHRLAQGSARRGVVDYLRHRHGRTKLPDRPAPAQFVYRRLIDATARFGAPALLATPTVSTGHVDPEVFAERVRLLEEAGREPGAYDLDQALLRLPGDASARVLDGLVSPAAKSARAWIEGGGLPEPAVSYEVVGFRRRKLEYWEEQPKKENGKRLRTVLRGTATGSAGLLTDLDTGALEDSRAVRAVARWWAPILPSHRELTAAHLLRQAERWPLDRYEQGEAVLDLADATGKTGAATAALLLYALSSPHSADRAGALDAVLSFAAQDALPAAAMGELLPVFVKSGDVSLSRVVQGLTEAARAGAPLWPLFANAVPTLLPTADESTPAPLADLLAAASTTATLHHIRTPLPALTTWTPKSPTSRAAKEALHLTALLTTP